MKRQLCEGLNPVMKHRRANGLKLATATLLTVITLGTLAAFSAYAEDKAVAKNMLYVATNDPRPGMNAILAYRRAANGTLSFLASYPTSGRGVGNPGQTIGPNDADQDLIISPDHKTLFAVNPGSDTIAVFQTNSDGSLKQINNSPFTSGGVNPVSLGLSGNQLYVVNKNQDPERPNSALPNYTGFRVAGNGHLSAIPYSTVELGAGYSPTQALISPSGDLMFGMQLFPGPLNGVPGLQPGYLDSFRIGANGRLNRVPGTPLAVPSDSPPVNAIAPFNMPLNGAVHPTLPILYVNFVTFTQIGVYTYGNTGALSFFGAVGNSGVAPCWDVISNDAKYMYTANAFDNSVSTYSLTNPYVPSEIQHLSLGGISGAFRISVDPTGKYVYILDQKIEFNFTSMTENQIHVLKIGADGKLTEVPGSTVILPVPSIARPQGILSL